MLQWTPDAFWNSTPLELTNAYIGHCRRHGMGPWAVDEHGWSDKSREEFKAEVARMRRRYPAGQALVGLTKEQKRAIKQALARGESIAVVRDGGTDPR